MTYEREIFDFLESRIEENESIVEIGANVGLLSTFFSKAFRSNSRRSVISFEPSRVAFRRLLDNLAANGADNVVAINAGMADFVGAVDLYEPEGHLTNGSLQRELAEKFSDTVPWSRVLAADGSVIASFVDPNARVFLKIDVEGAEALVLRGLRSFLGEYRVDLIIEVLGEYEDELNGLDFVVNEFRLFNITPHGPVERHRFEASGHRDYYLERKS